MGGYDTTSNVATPVGESEGPPSPILYLLSSNGLLCPFYCVNYKAGAPVLTKKAIAMPGQKRPGKVPYPESKTATSDKTVKLSNVESLVNVSSIFNQSKQSNFSFAQST